MPTRVVIGIQIPRRHTGASTPPVIVNGAYFGPRFFGGRYFGRRYFG